MEKKDEFPLIEPITAPTKLDTADRVGRIVPHIPPNHELSPLAKYLYERHHRQLGHGTITRRGKGDTV